MRERRRNQGRGSAAYSRPTLTRRPRATIASISSAGSARGASSEPGRESASAGSSCQCSGESAVSNGESAKIDAPSCPRVCVDGAYPWPDVDVEGVARCLAVETEAVARCPVVDAEGEARCPAAADADAEARMYAAGVYGGSAV